jgi:hypothetical protein
VPEDDDGIWLAYTFGWRRVVAFPDEFTAIIYVAAQGGRDHWEVSFAPFGEWFGAGVSSCVAAWEDRRVGTSNDRERREVRRNVA